MPRAAQEDIYRSIAMLGPCVDRHVGFCEQGDAGDALSFAEMMEVKADHRCPGALRSGAQGGFDQRNIVQHGTSVKIRQKVSAIIGHGRDHSRV